MGSTAWLALAMGESGWAVTATVRAPTPQAAARWQTSMLRETLPEAEMT